MQAVRASTFECSVDGRCVALRAETGGEREKSERGSSGDRALARSTLPIGFLR